MKVLLLNGSPNQHGCTDAALSEVEAQLHREGIGTERYWVGRQPVPGCIACNRCGMNGQCVFKDDFEFIRKHIADADLVAFATPMYYFGISAQIKTVIDRFYAINGQIHVPKKAVLMMTYADNSKKKESAIISHYEVLLDYLGWTDAGQIIAPGVWPVGAVNHTKFPEQAYRLGKTV